MRGAHPGALRSRYGEGLLSANRPARQIAARGGPVGLDTLAASISEETDTIEDVYEPYLLQLGFINRTPRGRIVTRAGYAHMNIPYPMD